MTTLAALATEMWGGALEPRGGRFAADGWTYDETLPAACPRCDSDLHVFGKPYATSKGEYRYAAYVCPGCNVVLAHDDFGVRSRNELKKVLVAPASSARHETGPSSPVTNARVPGPLWSVSMIEAPSGESAFAAAHLELERATLHSEGWDLDDLAGTSGRVMTAVVHEQQGNGDGCLSTEISVAQPSDSESSSLHLTTRECDCDHRGDAQEHTLGVRLARSLDLRIENAAAWVVGRTTRTTVDAFVNLVTDPQRRVPIVAVSGPLADERARSLLNKLCGAALVTTVDGDAAWGITERLGASQSCYAGAARVYPAVSHRLSDEAKPVWVSRRIAQLGWEDTEHDIAATVRALHGAPPRPWLEAEIRQELAREAAAESAKRISDLEDALRSRGEQTKPAPDIDALFDSLMAENSALNELVAELEIANTDLLAQVTALRAERDQLHSALKYANWQDHETQGADSIDIVDATVDDLIVRLADPDGPLVCTENALKAWRASNYPDDARMLRALRVLESAATSWRAADCQVGGRLEEWIYEQAQLRYAGSDKGLRQAGEDTFTFEGRTWSRVPHIKVDDAKHANQVGRIYFAIDASRRRWIVDHIGQKLYGR